MKFQVTMKDPDQLDDAVSDAVSETIRDMPEDEGEAIYDIRYEKIKKLTNEWFRYGEYLTVEIDTDARTIRVVPVKELDEK